MTVLLLLSQKAARVQQLISQQPVSEEGLYECRFFNEGGIFKVLVDDLLPCLKNEPAFAKTAGGKALYGLLLEKAWAKMHGSYERVEQDLSCHIMHSLTGAPAYQ